MKIQYRMADNSDVAELVALHSRVFDVKTHNLLLLGSSFMKHAYRWYCESPKAFTVVAQGEAGIVGCTTVNEGSYYSVFRQNWWHLIAAFASKPILFWHPMVTGRIGSLWTKFMNPAPREIVQKTAYLAYLAVDISARGQGVGGGLLKRTLAECRQRDWPTLITSFHRENGTARSLYKTLGFEEFPEINTDQLVGVRICTAGPGNREAGPNSAETKATSGK